jgi:protein-glutamine gamma-glutamyltransferase
MRNVTSERLLRVLIAALILIATALLGIGERTASLSLMSLVALAASAYFTDTKKIFHINQGVANAIALGVVCVSTTNAFYLDRHGLMVVVADLQSYLQYILLFQPKSPRVYWQLALLSLGQVAIASTLVPGPTFGAILIVYFFLGIATFLLLLAYTEQARFETSTSPAPTSPKVGLASAPVLWKNPSPRSPRLARSMFGQAALITTVTVSITAVIFFLLPRWNIPRNTAANSEPASSIGFSKKVTLGELKEVVNNPELVMRVEFYRSHGRIPFQLAHDPLLRGTVVTHYEGGEWSHSKSANLVGVPGEIRSPYVRQRITVEPLDVNELFCVFPVFALPNQAEPQLRFDLSFDQLVRNEDVRHQQLDFELGTSGIIEDRQRQFLPCDEELDDEDRDELLQVPTLAASQADPFPGLREVAASVLREKNIDPDDHVAAARALCDYFRTAGRYYYSLEPTERDAKLDPLEDFITRHPQGHCEYFAGALVMMLRTQNIPARIAVGYKGGEWNPLGMYYQVQQLHAHTWVEVYLDRKHVPEEAFAQDDLKPDAAWMTLDPTEGTLESNLASRSSGIWARARQIADYANVLWINYVAGLNSKRQRQGIYEPMVQGFSAAVDNLFSRKIWQDRFRAVASSPVGTFWDWYRNHWFSWRGGLVAVAFSLMLATLYFIPRWIVGLVRHGFRRQRAVEEPRAMEIYRRLEKALATLGFSRQPAQTAYEFAAVVGGELSETTNLRPVAHLPRRIVEAFYRVRFGGRTLDEPEVDAVEHALVELELALSRPR